MTTPNGETTQKTTGILYPKADGETIPKRQRETPERIKPNEQHKKRQKESPKTERKHNHPNKYPQSKKTAKTGQILSRPTEHGHPAGTLEP